LQEEIMKKSVLVSFFAIMLICLFTIPALAAGINVSAAASLREVVNELTGNYTKQNPGVVFQNNFGASGALAKQIENGAPADIFLSANMEWMDYLKTKNLIDEKNVSTFAFNVLVFVGKPETKLAKLQDVVKLEKIAIGSPKSVPAGEYAMEALKKAGLDTQLENKLVMAKDVRECLMYADRGEVDGAFVYKTDALQLAQNVKILFTVPQELYSRVTYPMAITREGNKKSDAAAFMKYLQSDGAQKVLLKYGFSVK